MEMLKYVLLGLALAPTVGGAAIVRESWVGTWAASQQIPEAQNAMATAEMKDVTLREIVHVSRGGRLIRVHFSNSFGTVPLHLTSAHIARPVAAGSGTIDPASDRALGFNGRPEVLIPPGAEYVSDPVAYSLGALSDLAISLHVEAEPGQQTGHPGSRETTFYVPGDVTGVATMPAAKKVDHWYFLSGVDVQGSGSDGSVVALGDSITDGHGATTNGNDRWTDVLAQRLQANAQTRGVGVLNEGIGGNHLLTDGLGPNVLARLDRDVLAQAGVRYLIVFEGINDLGALARTEDATAEMHEQLVSRMIGAYAQVIARAHGHGIAVYGATVMADTGSGYYHPDAASEADRQKVNAWIRGSGQFDGVVDLDTLTADPADPKRLLPAFDSGDHLHPGPVGYKAIGDAFALSLFR